MAGFGGAVCRMDLVEAYMLGSQEVLMREDVLIALVVLGRDYRW